MTSDVLSNVKFNVYREITEKIAKAIECGAGGFHMPWHGSCSDIALPANAATHAAYRGVNVLALWIDAVLKAYPSGYWASYRQWQSLGAQVRRGERGSLIVFFKQLEYAGHEAEKSGDEDRPRYVVRASRVFNAGQVEGWAPPPEEKRSDLVANEEVEAFVRATQAEIRHGFNTACYRRAEDRIDMPAREWFAGTPTSTATQSYYAVLLHELTHWSGAPHRLNRAFGERFGDRAYAFEELVAELGAAFLCSALGIANEPRPDHAAYVSSWLQILDRDHKAIFTAAKCAQAAVEYLGKVAASTLAQH